MTVYSTPRSVFYTADGTSTNFNVPFQFFEIDVYVGEELQTATAYTVTQEAPGLSGSVTFNVAPASGSIVTIVGNTAIIQEADYVEGDGFSAETHELVLDRLTMAVQELDARQTGEIDTPPISPDFALTAAQNANLVTFVDGHAYQTPLGNVLSINNISPIGRTLNVGAIVFHPFEEVPSGWIRLKATQQPVAKALYPEYAAKCEAEGWPYGHTSTHVNVPAISAFIRAWDDSGPGESNPMDPDGSSRLANGSATIVGNLIGSRQLSQNKAHNHAKGSLGGTADSAGKHRHGYVDRDAIGRDAGSGGVSLARGAGVSGDTAEAGEHSHSLTITGSTADSGGSEARPDNVAFPYIMLLSPGDAAAPHSVLGLPYNFDDGISDADPGTGNLRFNHATLDSATEVYISNEQAFGASISGFLDQYNENNAPTRGYLLVYAVANLGVCAIAKVTGNATIGSDYTKLPVEVLSSNGEFLDGMRISVQALPSGQISVSLDAAIAACEAAQTAAEIAQTGAEAAQEAAEDARDAAIVAQGAAESAATTATNAKNDAENARNDAVAAWDAFDDAFLGAHAADPTVDNDGDPLAEGQLYWSTTGNALKVYDGAAWVLYNPAYGGGAVADNVAGIKSTPVAAKSAILREAGREGTFIWRTGDYSAQVTADTAGGIYLASDYVASTSGAWVRVYDGPVLVTWFGAIGDGVADDTSAVSAAILSGAPLDWGGPGAIYRLTGEIVGTPAGPVNWVSNGARITYDPAAPTETMISLTVDGGSHVVQGELALDGAGDAFTGFRLYNAADNEAFLRLADLTVEHCNRSSTAWQFAAGIDVRGLFARVDIVRPRVRNILMGSTAGATPNICGIMVGTRSTSPFRAPRLCIISDPWIENVYALDTSYKADQDGIKVFGAEDAGDWPWETKFIVRAGTVKNCRGRSIKVQSDYALVDAVHFVRTAGAAAPSDGIGNPEIDFQTGGGVARHITALYEDHVPSWLAVFNGPVTATKNVPFGVLDGAQVSIKGAIALQAVVGAAARNVAGNKVLASDLTVTGLHTYLATLAASSGTTPVGMELKIDGAICAPATALVRTNTNTAWQGDVIVSDIKNTGAAVPLLSKGGALQNVSLHADKVLGFSGTGTLTIASGAVSAMGADRTNPLVLDTEGAATTDDLTTLSEAGHVGQTVVLRIANNNRQVTVKHATGNIILAGGSDFALNHVRDRLSVQWDGARWVEVSRADNGTAVAITPTVWNSADKQAAITLSGGDLTVTTPTTPAGMIRSAASKSTGKYYFEVTCDAVVVAGTWVGSVGVAKSGASLSGNVGADANGWSYLGTGQKFNNGASTAYGASFTEGDTISVLLDLDAGEAAFWKNGVSQGVAFTGLSGTFFAALGDGNTGRGTVTTTNFGATPFRYVPPEGYTWGFGA